jgi:glucan biosynthesis protein C
VVEQGQPLVERVKRLLIPLYTVGLFILVVLQVYFDGVTHGRITGAFGQWLPSYYGGLLDTIFLTPRRLVYPLSLLPYGFSGHLWFIQMLFLVSLVTLPPLLWLRSDRSQRLIARLAEWSGRPGGMLPFVIPFAIVQVALRWLP